MVMPIARFPELYGIVIGAFLGVASQLIGIAIREWVGVEIFVRYGWEIASLLLFASFGGFAGAFFGAGLRVIYLLGRRAVPYRFVTFMTLGICLPLYVITKLASVPQESVNLSAWSIAASSLIVLLVLAAMEWWRARVKSLAAS